MSRRRVVTAVIVGGLTISVGSAFGIVRADRAPAPASVASAGAVTPVVSGAGLDRQRDALLARVQQAPGDWTSWATLGLVYVEQARISPDPRLYDAASEALSRSMDLHPDENFAALAGRAALAAARHDFAEAHALAQRGLDISPSNPILLGTLADAAIELGRYDDAWATLQQMVDIRPDTASLARVSYSWELRGRRDRATRYMERALEAAPTPADRAFARLHLGNLAFDDGDLAAALGHYEAGLDADPEFQALLGARARARAASGDTPGAFEDYEAVVAALPLPEHLLAYAELLQSLGRADDAARQLGVFDAAQRLLAAAGVAPDIDAVLYEADHGDPATAVSIGRKLVRERPFVDAQDAYAWALHEAGRSGEALEWSTRARSLGGASALTLFHAGMIELELGDSVAARRDLQAALDRNPAFHPLHAPTAAAAIADLDAR